MVFAKHVRFHSWYLKRSADLDAVTTDGTTDFGIKYSMSGANVFYGATEDLSSVGVSGSIAGFTVGVGSKSVIRYQRKSK